VSRDVLVLAGHDAGVPRASTLQLLTLARRWGRPVAVHLGAGAELARPELAAYGAAELLVLDDARAERHPVAPAVEALAHAAAGRELAAVLLPAGGEGREIAGRLAVRLDAGVLADATPGERPDEAEQSVLAGGTLVRAAVVRGVPILAVVANAVAAEPLDTSTELVAAPLALELSDAAFRTVVTQRTHAPEGARPPLAEARAVVAGGLGLGSADGFALAERLADRLGAAVGASRAATDALYCERALQIGQTGSVVSPELYVALGISGAIQHVAGMQGARTVVAINRDPEAPMLELADLAVVGDAFEIVPALIAELDRR
jgi:electron transfer flavoprotein alpha subunit